MAIDQAKLLALLPQYDGQDAAVVAATLSAATITVTPATLVTAATLGLLWGDDAAANFIDGLKNLLPAPKAAYFTGLLYGTGIDFGNESVRTMADGLVALVPALAGAVTQLKALAEVRTYPCGDVVSANDVTAARTSLALEPQAVSLRQYVANTANAARTSASTLEQARYSLIDQGQQSGTLPTQQQLDAVTV